MDTPSRSLRSVATGPLQGVALALYFVLLPYVLETKWRFSYTITNGALLRDLLVGLGIFWAIFLVLLVVYVNQLRQRRTVPANGCAWLAGLIIIALPFLVTSSAGAAATQSPRASVASVVARPALDQSSASNSSGAWRVPSPASHRGFALFALALAAKGRRDHLTGAPRDLSDDELDELAWRLHEGDAQLIAQLRDVVGSARDGEVLITDAAFEVDARLDFDPVAVSLIADRSDGLALGYAREGGALPVDMSWSDDDLATRIVALHDGTVTFAQSDNELMRALARRRDLSTLVVYLGDPAELDEEIRALCVTLRAASGTVDFREGSTREVRVELLRAYPQVQGLEEDFTPTLRRRCVEMVA